MSSKIDTLQNLSSTLSAHKSNNVILAGMLSNTSLPAITTASTWNISNTITAATDNLEQQSKFIEKSMKEFIDFLEYKGVFTAQEFNDFINSRRVLEKLSETENL